MNPDLSILLITYNHEKYIAKAIESILEQETEYTFQIHVIEDCSTDNTQKVISSYVNKYPKIVIPHFNKKNIGNPVTQKNFIRGLRLMNGKYFAVLEGDDFWTSKDKVQKQINFLELNPDYVATSHNVIKFYEDGTKPPHRFLHYAYPEDNDISRLIKLESFFHGSTMMMRNVFLTSPPPNYFSNRYSCEIFLNIYTSQFGKVRYMNDDMTAYRAHSGGLFSNMDAIDGWFFNISGLIRYHYWLDFRYTKDFSESISKYCKHLLTNTNKDGVRALTKFELIKYSSIQFFYRTLAYLCSIQKVNFQKVNLNILESISNLIYLFLIYCLPTSIKNDIKRLEYKYPGFTYYKQILEQRKLLTGHGILITIKIIKELIAIKLKRVIK